MSVEGIRYGDMTPDEFVAHLLDEDGLVGFVALYLRSGFSLRKTTEFIWSLSRNQWQPTPEYVESLYDMQAERLRRLMAAA